MMSTSGELRFAPLLSQAETSFWQRLKQEKLDRYRLDESPVALRAYLPALCPALGVEPAVALDSSSFDVAPGSSARPSPAPTTGSDSASALAGNTAAAAAAAVSSTAGPTRSLCLPIRGRLVNYNTFERFRDVHKQTLIIQEAEEVRHVHTYSTSTPIAYTVLYCIAVE